MSFFLKMEKQNISVNSVISPNCVIGEGTKIWDFVVIREEVVIGKDCVIAKGVYIDKGVRIGDNVKIMNNAGIGLGYTLEDNVFIGPNVCLTDERIPRACSNLEWKSLKTTIKKGATIGANSIILPGKTIGSHSFIGAGTLVRRKVPDYGFVMANPGTREGYVCKCGSFFTETFYCKVCNTRLEKGKIIK